jgi:CheY-like chemotaxis protein
METGMRINAVNERMNNHQRTVLIVDDTLEDRHLYRRFLLKDEEWRYHTLEAETGAEAIRAVSRNATRLHPARLPAAGS